MNNVEEQIATNGSFVSTNDVIKKYKEIVICAAVIATDGSIIRGHRHADCIHTMKGMGLKPKLNPNAQGFITSKNRYVTREQGRKIQDEARIESASPEGYFGTTLYSEDLY